MRWKGWGGEGEKDGEKGCGGGEGTGGGRGKYVMGSEIRIYFLVVSKKCRRE